MLLAAVVATCFLCDYGKANKDGKMQYQGCTSHRLHPLLDGRFMLSAWIVACYNPINGSLPNLPHELACGRRWNNAAMFFFQKDIRRDVKLDDDSDETCVLPPDVRF